jgi:hypothetical protein
VRKEGGRRYNLDPLNLGLPLDQARVGVRKRRLKACHKIIFDILIESSTDKSARAPQALHAKNNLGADNQNASVVDAFLTSGGRTFAWMRDKTLPVIIERELAP